MVHFSQFWILLIWKRTQGVVLTLWGGGGDSKLWLFWKGGVIRPINEACTDEVDAAYSKLESLGYLKNSMFIFYAAIAIGQFFPVILAFPRYRWAKATRTGVTNSKIAEDIWFSYLYLKLRFTFTCTNYIQSTSITSDHGVSITQTNTLLVLLTLTHSLQFWFYLQFKSGIVKCTVLYRQY